MHIGQMSTARMFSECGCEVVEANRDGRYATGPRGTILGLLSDSVWRPLPHNKTPDQQDDYCSDDSAD